MNNSFLAISTKTNVDNLSLNSRAKALQNMLEGLTEDCRIPFMMFFKGYSQEEIAKELNAPIGVIKNKIFVARKELRNMILQQKEIAHLKRA